jgi:hypothetical protein
LENFSIANIKGSTTGEGENSASASLLKVYQDKVKISDGTIASIELSNTNALIQLQAKTSIDIAKLRLQDQDKSRAGILKMEGDKVSISDSSFTNVNLDPLGHQAFFESKAAGSQGGSFSWTNSPVSNCKDTKLLSGAPTQSSQLFKLSHGSVQISSSDFTDIHATSGVTGAAKQSLKCEAVKLKGLTLRKGVMNLKGDNVLMNDVTVEAVAIHPLAHEQLLQIHADQLDSSTLALTNLIVKDLKDVELAKSSEELSTQVLNLKSHSVTMTTITLENIEATSGIGVEAKKVEVSSLTWSGVNNFRKSIIDMVGDTILMQESSLDNLNVDPLGSDKSKDPEIFF